MEDADLIARVLVKKDQGAFGELVKRHQSLVRSLLRKWLGENNAQADDLAQLTFVKAHGKLAQFGGQARFSTWLCQIAYREFLIWKRSVRFHENLDEAQKEWIAPPVGASFDLRHDLERALKFLSMEERYAIVCCSMHGMTHEEASSILGWPMGTVKTHVLRGKEKLRSLLAEWNRKDKL